jgi:hypothetical protein
MPAAVTEKQVVGIWRDSLQDRRDLKTVDHEPVTIIYPGRRNDDRGADFTDAIINTRRGPAKGDIEIHVKTSHWWTHRHHLDPAYNRVILHVVYQHDTVKGITLENGFTVPTLALNDYTGNDSISRPLSPIPCRGVGYHGNVALLTNRLDEAGEARFLTRAPDYQKMIRQAGAGQALYQGIMTALGYSKNKDPMAELSRLTPLAKLEAYASEEISDEQYLARCQAYLMGAAGLLPSQQTENYPRDKLKEDWGKRLENSWALSGSTECMSASDWHTFKVRPGNFPVRRIAAMSHLLCRYRPEGLLNGLENILKQTADFREVSLLEEALMVAPDGYWSRYLDFGIPSLSTPPALLGQERAVDIIVNVLLPFFYISRSPEDGEKVLDIYRDYRTSAENTLVKHMRQQLGITRYLVNTTRRQQGLIHIYKTYCLEGNCAKCPISRLLD